MKKIMVVAAAAIMFFGLTACGSSDTNNTATDTYTTAPAPVETYEPTPEDNFLTGVHSLNDPMIETTDDSTLLSIGHSTCRILNQGYSVNALVTTLSEQGAITTSNAEAVGKILGAAIVTMCPEYTSDMQDFINANS